MASARVLTRPRRVAVAVAAMVFLIVGTGTGANATPSISDIESQINSSWNKLEPLVEKYDELQTQLSENKTKSEKLAKQLNPLQIKVDLTLTRVSAMSAQLYEYGETSPLDAMLTSGNPATMADQMSTLDAMAHRQSDTIAGAMKLVNEYNSQKKPLDALIATESVQSKDLAKEKNDIQSQMDDLQKLRRQVYGETGRAGGSLEPVACPAELTTGPGAIAARTACAQIGKPYVWDADGPSSFDCSGLMLYAWKAAGVTLGHFTGWQWSSGTPISRDQLQPGDLVFYFSDHHHVSMYVGDGWVVHAPTTGDVVRMTQLSNPYLPIDGYRRP